MKRREWMQNGGAARLGAIADPYVKKTYWPETKLHCVFGLSVITDEITQDFGHALAAARLLMRISMPATAIPSHSA
jgi:hypothetical protein